MLTFKHIKYEIKRLSKAEKAIGLGSLFVILSVFLPWYSDLDAWGVGNRFSAIIGPLYLIGFFILFLGIFSLFIIASKVIARKKWKLPVQESLLQMATGTIILFFLIIANSVFFHKDFGVNVIRKESNFGMFLAFIGAILIAVGGYFINKEEEKIARQILSKTEEKPEPLINLNNRNSRILKEKSINTKDNKSLKKSEDNINLKLNI